MCKAGAPGRVRAGWPGSSSETAWHEVRVRQGSPANWNRGAHYAAGAGGCFREPVRVTGRLLVPNPAGQARGTAVALSPGVARGRGPSSRDPGFLSQRLQLIGRGPPITVVHLRSSKNIKTCLRGDSWAGHQTPGTVASRRGHAEVTLREHTCSLEACRWAWPLAAGGTGSWGQAEGGVGRGGGCSAHSTSSCPF